MSRQAAPEAGGRSAELARPAEDPAVEYAARRAAAGADVEKLWELARWCEAFGLAKERRSCMRAILKEDRGHRGAHEALGHVEYGGQWFTSEKKMKAFKKREEKRIAKEQGLVQFKGEWVKAEDIPFLKKGWVRDEAGAWMDPETLARIEAGWAQQDLAWVPPEEIPLMRKGLWKCGEEWISLSAANDYHSRQETWWEIPTEHWLLRTTCKRATARTAIEEMDLARRDLVRLFGLEPSGRVPVVLLRSTDQYSIFANGDSESPARENLGWSSIHGAFFAETWKDWTNNEYLGTGVAYWDDSTPDGAKFGRLFARHAAGLSFVEAMDPSPKATAKFVKSSKGRFDPKDFYGEKRIELWLRYGAAAYVERYFVDATVAAGGKPYWAREWSVSNLLRRGGLEPLSSFFEMPLSASDAQSSALSNKLINQAGLLVSFVLDGGCEPVSAAHGELKQCLGDEAAGQGALAEAFEKFRTAIREHEADLKKFAGI